MTDSPQVQYVFPNLVRKRNSATSISNQTNDVNTYRTYVGPLRFWVQVYKNTCSEVVFHERQRVLLYLRENTELKTIPFGMAVTGIIYTWGGCRAKCTVSRRCFAVIVCDLFTRSNCTQRFFLGNGLRCLCGNDTVAVAMHLR